MYLVQVIPPAIEPITYGELIEYLRIQAVDKDRDLTIIELMNTMIQAARDEAENFTARKLITQTWDYSINDWPGEDYFKLPFGNLSTITSIKWKDEDGTETELTVTTDYLVETNGEDLGRIVLPYGGSWPSGTLYPSNPITTRFICGYGDEESDVPPNIRLAIFEIAGWMWDHRGESYEMSKAVERLLWPFRIFTEF